MDILYGQYRKLLYKQYQLMHKYSKLFEKELVTITYREYYRANKNKKFKYCSPDFECISVEHNYFSSYIWSIELTFQNASKSLYICSENDNEYDNIAPDIELTDRKMIIRNSYSDDDYDLIQHLLEMIHDELY